MSDDHTVRADRFLAREERPNPPGLLRFYPLGTPPRMACTPLGGEVIVGRADDCSIHVEDELLSRKHAALHAGDAGGWQIADLQSANGTFVNGRRITRCALHGGELIRVGGTLFLFLAEGTAAEPRQHTPQTTGMVSGPRLEPLRELIARVANSKLAVLIAGETGTGKEIAARALHHASPRRDGPFVPVNCAALPAEIIESELFGHVKGAFTGATADSPGLIRQASAGTLFLDEIGELPKPSQATLLRVLQDHRVRPVGGARAHEVDLRVICATNRRLAERVQQRAFRPDLYARIAEVELHLPALAQRVEDIPLLVQHFVAKHAEATAPTLSADVLELLCCSAWPLNIRQLESAVRRALLAAGSRTALLPSDFAVAGPAAAAPPVDGVDEQAPAGGDEAAGGGAATALPARARRLLDALRKHAGKAGPAAAELGISRSQVYRRAKKYGIDLEDFKQ